MSIEKNKGVILRLWDQFNIGSLEVISECFSDKFIRYAIDGTVMDREGYAQFCARGLNMTPDIQVKIGDIVAEGDKVAFSITISGTYKDESKEKSSKIKRFTMAEAYFSRFEAGKIVEFRNFQAQRQEE